MNHEFQTIATDQASSIPPSIRRHLDWQTLSEIAGSLGAPGAFVAYRFWRVGFPVGVVDGSMFISLFVVGYLVPRAVFRHFMGATCPHCHGKVFPKGTKPVIYVCRSCRHSYPTELWEGDDGQIIPGHQHEEGDDR